MQILEGAASHSVVDFAVQPQARSLREMFNPCTAPDTQPLVPSASSDRGCTVRPDNHRSSAQPRMSQDNKCACRKDLEDSLSVSGIIRKLRFTLRQWFSVSLKSNTIFQAKPYLDAKDIK